MWTLFCNILLDCLFAWWCLIKFLLECCSNCYVAFSYEKFLCNKSLLFFWYLRHCNLESPPKNVFLNIFISIFSPKLSNYDPCNSLLIFQFPNYLINKAIVLSNQHLVKFYENSSLGLCSLQKHPVKGRVFHIFLRLPLILEQGDSFKNFCGSCYRFQFKPYATSKMEILVTKK